MLDEVDRDGDGATDASLCASGADCDDTSPDRRPGATEVCDAIDDDCDGWVDEDPSMRLRALTTMGDAPTVLPSDGLDAIDFSLGISGVGYTEVVRDGSPDTRARVRALDIRFDETAPMLAGAHDALWAWTVFSPSMDAFVAPPSPAFACASVLPLAGATPPFGCDMTTTSRRNGSFDELTIAAIPSATTGWIAAAVDRTVCPAGRLRVGLIDGLSANAVVATPGGPLDSASGAPISNTWLGIDLDAAACSGASGAPAGAHAASIVAVPGSSEYRAEALVAWRGGPRPSDRCTTSEAPLLALGLWVELRPSGASYVSAEGDGAPRELGIGSGYAPAAVAYLEGDAVRAGGFLIAYSARSSVEVAFVPDPVDAPARYTGAVRTMPRFGTTTTLGSFAASAADDVSIVVHRYREPGGGVAALVGLTWREGCAGNGAGAIVAAALTIDPEGSVTPSDPIAIAPDGTGPSIAWSPRADRAEPGALLVAFVPRAGGEVSAARVDVATDLALAVDGPRPVYTRIDADVRAAVVRSGATGDASVAEAPYLLVVDDARRSLLGGPLVCTPR